MSEDGRRVLTAVLLLVNAVAALYVQMSPMDWWVGGAIRLCKDLIAVIEHPDDLRHIGTTIRNVNALGVEKACVVSIVTSPHTKGRTNVMLDEGDYTQWTKLAVWFGNDGTGISALALARSALCVNIRCAASSRA